MSVLVSYVVIVVIVFVVVVTSEGPQGYVLLMEDVSNATNVGQSNRKRILLKQVFLFMILSKSESCVCSR